MVLVNQLPLFLCISSFISVSRLVAWIPSLIKVSNIASNFGDESVQTKNNKQQFLQQQS